MWRLFRCSQAAGSGGGRRAETLRVENRMNRVESCSSNIANNRILPASRTFRRATPSGMLRGKSPLRVDSSDPSATSLGRELCAR
mmetsp:Transcript_15557/g.36440  ORF Transcript_15557/g.36440 Transcript_15557/m.36440 type:complete len:85 (+) Transcript_15557:210-464(+)